MKFLDMRDTDNFQNRLNAFTQRISFVTADNVSGVDGGKASRIGYVTVFVDGGNSVRRTSCILEGGKR